MKDEIDAWSRLLAEDPVTGYRIAVIAIIMAQRDISSATIARELGVSRMSVSKTLQPQTVRLPGDKMTSNSRTVETTTAWLDRIEEAVSKYTAEHGGVFELTGTTELGSLAWQDHVQEHAYREETDAYG